MADSTKTSYYENRFRNYAGILYKDETGYFFVIESATNLYGKKMMQYLLFIKIASLLILTILIFSVGMYFPKIFQPIRSVINSVKKIS